MAHQGNKSGLFDGKNLRFLYPLTISHTWMFKRCPPTSVIQIVSSIIQCSLWWMKNRKYSIQDLMGQMIKIISVEHKNHDPRYKSCCISQKAWNGSKKRNGRYRTVVLNTFWIHIRTDTCSRPEELGWSPTAAQVHIHLRLGNLSSDIRTFWARDSFSGSRSNTSYRTRIWHQNYGSKAEPVSKLWVQGSALDPYLWCQIRDL